MLCTAIYISEISSSSHASMSENNKYLLQLLALTKKVKDKVSNYDYEAAVKRVETEINSAVTQGVDLVQERAPRIVKRLVLK